MFNDRRIYNELQCLYLFLQQHTNNHQTIHENRLTIIIHLLKALYKGELERQSLYHLPVSFLEEIQYWMRCRSSNYSHQYQIWHF